MRGKRAKQFRRLAKMCVRGMDEEKKVTVFKEIYKAFKHDYKKSRQAYRLSAKEATQGTQEGWR